MDTMQNFDISSVVTERWLNNLKRNCHPNGDCTLVEQNGKIHSLRDFIFKMHACLTVNLGHSSWNKQTTKNLSLAVCYINDLLERSEKNEGLVSYLVRKADIFQSSKVSELREHTPPFFSKKTLAKIFSFLPRTDCMSTWPLVGKEFTFAKLSPFLSKERNAAIILFEKLKYIKPISYIGDPSMFEGLSWRYSSVAIYHTNDPYPDQAMKSDKIYETSFSRCLQTTGPYQESFPLKRTFLVPFSHSLSNRREIFQVGYEIDANWDLSSEQKDEFQHVINKLNNIVKSVRPAQRQYIYDTVSSRRDGKIEMMDIAK